MTPLIKICGLNSEAAVTAAVAAGATHGGFMFFEKSPRFVRLETARDLSAHAGGLVKVAVMVDPDDTLIDDLICVVAPDMLQLHGAETPERVAAVATRGLPVIKALGVSAAEDVAKARGYAAASMILFDAKPPRDASRPGGHGAVFDWSLLTGDLPANWILSGGLSPANLAEAIARTRAPGVDASSSLEDAPGVKSPARIAAFTAAARAAYGLPSLDHAA
ncbi:MAG: phosphoribosylanthranilate isomerase [Micropepsaceae bacterium]